MTNKADRRMTRLFYFLIGLASSLGLGLVFYYILRLDSTIGDLSRNTTPSYFWSYILLTLGTVILFGINMAFFTYRIRKYGFPKMKNQLSAGFGSLLGVAASACPVCGSTLLSAIGIAGGLSAFPFSGLELKSASFALMIVPIWLTAREIKNFQCGTGVCPMPRDASYKKEDMSWIVIIVGLIIAMSFIGARIANSQTQGSMFCGDPAKIQAN